jgi:hypothetical protein
MYPWDKSAVPGKSRRRKVRPQSTATHAVQAAQAAQALQFALDRRDNGGDAQGSDTQGSDTQGRDTQGRDTQGRDTQGRDDVQLSNAPQSGNAPQSRDSALNTPGQPPARLARQ